MADQCLPSQQFGYNAGVFTGGNVETLIFTGSGRVCSLAVTTAGTAVMSIYDGTNSTAGTLIYTSITNSVSGATAILGIPVSAGIVVKGTTGTQGVSLTYNGPGVYGKTS